MTKRINWKKGMRLTDDILRASDNCIAELVGRAFALATVGRFGLLPSSTPFTVSLTVSKSIVDVNVLNCLAVTKGGQLIDVHYDTTFTNSFDTRIQIPDISNEDTFILTINVLAGQWKATNDGYEQPVFSFSLMPVNSPVPENSLPIARIVNQYGWHQDEIDFIPPCLYISAHPKYLALHKEFSDLLSSIDAKIQILLRSNRTEAIRVFWPILLQLMIKTNKECDIMTPTSLLANVQRCVSAFICACELDDSIKLAEIEQFNNYVRSPYNYKDVYQRIKEGLNICLQINEKVEKLNVIPEEPVPQEPIKQTPPPRKKTKKQYTEI